MKQARSANAAATAANAGRIGALARDPAVPIDQALLLGAQAEALDPGVPEDSNLLAALARSPSLAAAARSPSRVLSLAVSADGSRVVTAGVEGQVVTWDAATLHQISLQQGASAAMVGIGPDGTLVVGRQAGHVGVEFLGPGGSVLQEVPVPEGPAAPIVAADGDWVAYVADEQPSGRSGRAPADLPAEERRVGRDGPPSRGRVLRVRCRSVLPGDREP